MTKNTNKKIKIGFIGQGFIGKNYADDFEKRGYEVVRYALEKPYLHNKLKIKACDYVFIAVPTPTTKKGFNYSIVDEAINLVGDKKVAIIKSTILPGTTEKLQKKYKHKIVLHSPEFLTEKTAAYDAEYPERNIVGYVQTKHKPIARKVLKLLAPAPYNKLLKAADAELIKYACNCFFYTKVVYMNILYDLAQELHVDWKNIKEALENTEMIANWHLEPIHKSGRGAGGHCLIKDYAALFELYSKKLPQDATGNKLLKLIQKKNIELLKSTHKNVDILEKIFN